MATLNRGKRNRQPYSNPKGCSSRATCSLVTSSLFLFTLAMKTSLLLLCVCALAAFTFVPAVSANLPDSQLKAAGDIELTTDLLDKMEKAATAIRADDAARAE